MRSNWDNQFLNFIQIVICQLVAASQKVFLYATPLKCCEKITSGWHARNKKISPYFQLFTTAQFNTKRVDNAQSFSSLRKYLCVQLSTAVLIESYGKASQIDCRTSCSSPIRDLVLKNPVLVFYMTAGRKQYSTTCCKILRSTTIIKITKSINNRMSIVCKLKELYYP